MVTLQNRLQFMESQAAFIESRARMIQHGSIQYPDLVGIDREASPYADVITYYSWDGSGDMVDISNRGNDYPFVQVSQQQHNVNIEWKGLAYDWTDREIGRAMLVGMPLSDRKVRMAFRIWEELKDGVFINGDSSKGWDGFINNSNVTPLTALTTTFAASTGEVIAEAVNNALNAIHSGTNQVRIADTLCLPVEQANLLTKHLSLIHISEPTRPY